jgi:SanA protein
MYKMIGITANLKKLKDYLIINVLRKRVIKIVLFTSVIIILILTTWANFAVIKTSRNYITDDISKVEIHKTGLLLGTSRNLKNGNRNEFFFNRIDATVRLFKSGKIKNIIISGDNSKTNYNEPLDMKTELIKGGIPDSAIYLDYAGFRTLDAVVRAKEIFGQNSFIVISQKFHNERAVFLARKYGIIAFGYNAKEVTAYNGFKTKLREVFARDKMFIDLIFGVKPKFMGDKVIIK